MLNVLKSVRQEVIPRDEQADYPAMAFSVRRLLLFSALGIVALSSCQADRDKDGLPDDKDKCPTEYAKTASGCLPEQKINAVRFFIDRSGSMSGYYKGATEFVNTTDDLLTKINSSETINGIWLVSDFTEKFGGDVKAFRDSILRSQPKPGNSSMMGSIFETIASNTDSNDISVFISDGILSYSGQSTKINKNINIDRISQMKGDIFTVFDNLKKRKHFSTSIYAFKSVYNGFYYNYQNVRVKLSGEQRPYYVWAVGRKELLKKFDAELAGFSTFAPLEQLHFGLEEEPLTKPTFIPSIDKLGEWSLNDEGTGIKDIGKSSARCCVALDLSTLPPYAQKLDYLKEHIHLNTKGCDATLQIKSKQEASNAKLRSNRQKADFESSTHLFVIEVTRMNMEHGSVQIVLPILPDPWYQSWSCENDLNPKQTCKEKTFAFNYLIDGIIQAYQSTPKDYINITIPLQQ